jgi:hypothetical protein
MPVAQALSAFRRSRRGDLPEFPIIFPISSAKTGSHPTASATTHSRDRSWANQLRRRRGFNRATVAVANKNTRIICAVLRTGEPYRAPSEDPPRACETTEK